MGKLGSMTEMVTKYLIQSDDHCNCLSGCRILHLSEAATGGVLWKKVLFGASQNSQEDTGNNRGRSLEPY